MGGTRPKRQTATVVCPAGGFDGDIVGVGIWESGRGREGSVVQCGDNLQREINGGHDVGRMKDWREAKRSNWVLC
jgi:hypothetical protein